MDGGMIQMSWFFQPLLLKGVRRCSSLRSFQPRKNDKQNATTNPELHRKPPESFPLLKIIYSDEDFVAVEKPADIRISGDFKHTIKKMLLNRFPHMPEPHACHQLDYATSGVMLWAFNSEAARKASECFASRTALKLYLAIVEGHVNGPKLDIDISQLSALIENWKSNVLHSPGMLLSWPIAPDSAGGFHMHIAQMGDKGAREAHTILWTLQHGFDWRGHKASMSLEFKCGDLRQTLLQPLTGRRHQLRLHLLHAGHPVVGDATYGPLAPPPPPRMMLHAAALRLPALIRHPSPTTPAHVVMPLTWERKAQPRAGRPEAEVQRDDGVFAGPDNPLAAFFRPAEAGAGRAA